MGEKVPRSEFSPDPNPNWKPLEDRTAPPSATRANLEDRYVTPSDVPKRSGRRA